MYAVGLIWIFPIAIFSMVLNLPNLLFGFLLFTAPLTFHAWRNKLSMKEMVFVSFIFGASVVFITLIIIFVFGFLFSVLSPFSPQDTSFSNISLFGVVSGSLLLGLTAVVVGLHIWLLVTKFVHEKKKTMPPVKS